MEITCRSSLIFWGFTKVCTVNHLPLLSVSHTHKHTHTHTHTHTDTFNHALSQWICPDPSSWRLWSNDSLAPLLLSLSDLCLLHGTLVLWPSDPACKQRTAAPPSTTPPPPSPTLHYQIRKTEPLRASKSVSQPTEEAISERLVENHLWHHSSLPASPASPASPRWGDARARLWHAHTHPLKGTLLSAHWPEKH